jgi:hypothetical protein
MFDNGISAPDLQFHRSFLHALPMMAGPVCESTDSLYRHVLNEYLAGVGANPSVQRAKIAAMNFSSEREDHAEC